MIGKLNHVAIVVPDLEAADLGSTKLSGNINLGAGRLNLPIGEEQQVQRTSLPRCRSQEERLSSRHEQSRRRLYWKPFRYVQIIHTGSA